MSREDLSAEAGGPERGPRAAAERSGAETAGEAGEPSTSRDPGEPSTTGVPASAIPDSYEAAASRIEEIIRRLDSGEGGLRETLDLCREGRSLVEFCAGELEAVGRGLEELRLDELVTRLEGGGRTPP